MFCCTQSLLKKQCIMQCYLLFILHGPPVPAGCDIKAQQHTGSNRPESEVIFMYATFVAKADNMQVTHGYRFWLSIRST